MQKSRKDKNNRTDITHVRESVDRTEQIERTEHKGRWKEKQ